jgi:WD40 repeat protein
MNCRLEQRFIFGVQETNVGCTVSFFDEHHIVYLAGNTVIVQDVVTKAQRFVYAKTDFRIIGLTACNNVLALIQEPYNQPFIPSLSIYENSIERGHSKTIDIQTDEALTYTPLCNRQEKIQLCIHNNTKFLAVVLRTSEKVYTLFCWKCDGTLLAQESLHLNMAAGTLQMSFHPDDSLICIQSDKTFWLYRIVQSASNWSLRLLNFPFKHDPNHDDDQLILTCHAWIADTEATVVFGTKGGVVLVTEGGKIVSSLSVGYHIKSLLGLSSSFILGGSGASGRVYRKESSVEENYCCISTFIANEKSLGTDMNLISMCLSMSRVKACLFLSGVNEIYMLNLNKNIDIDEHSLVLIASGQPDIHAIACCIQKSIILTASSDRTVRCWDYMLGKQLVCKQFVERPIAVSLHPSGLHAIIALEDEVQCVHLLPDDLWTFWQIRLPRKNSCSVCIMSHGGQQFAISNDSSIRILDFYSGRLLNELKGHNCKVCQIKWRQCDSEIISIDEDSNILRWDVTKAIIIGECSRYKANMGCTDSLICNEALWVPTHGAIEVISIKTFELKGKINIDQSKTMNLMSNDDLSIVLIGLFTQDKHKLHLSSCPYTTMKEISVYQSMDLMNICGNMVFTKSISNSLHMLELLQEPTANALITKTSRSRIIKRSSCDHCLVSEMHLDEKEAKIHELTTLIHEVESNHDFNLNLMRIKNKEEIITLLETNKEKKSVQDDELKFRDKKVEVIEKQFHDTAKIILSKHQDQHVLMENEHNAKLKELFEKYNHDKLTFDQQLKDMISSKNAAITKFNISITNQKTCFMKDLNDSVHMTKTLHNEIASHRLEFEECKEQVEDELDELLQTQNNYNEQMIADERQMTLKVSSDNGILNKRFSALTQNIDDQKEVIKHLLYREEVSKDKIDEITNTLLDIDSTRQNRTNILHLKEDTISRFRSRKEELTKFNVLEDKIKDLNDCVFSDKTIPFTKEDIHEKAQLLSTYYSDHAQAKQLLATIHDGGDTKKKVLGNESLKLLTLKNKIESMKQDLHHCASLINCPSQLLNFVDTRMRELSGKKSGDSKNNITTDESDKQYYFMSMVSELRELRQSLHNESNLQLEELESLRSSNQQVLEVIKNILDKNKEEQSRTRKVKK